MIKISKISHHNQTRIKIESAENKDITIKIRKIPGAKWSNSLQTWHLPYSKEAFTHLKNQFHGEEISIVEERESHPSKQHEPFNRNQIRIDVTDRKIFIKLPRNEADIRFITNLKYSRWDKTNFHWIIPNYPGNLDLIKDYFQNRIHELNYLQENDIQPKTTKQTPEPNTLTIFKTREGRLRLIFPFNNILMKRIRNFPYHRWDDKNKWWTIPFSERYLTELQEYAKEMEWAVKMEEEKIDNNAVKRASPFDVPNYRKCPDEMAAKLTELRYSPRTLKVYTSMFEEFINYHYSLEINNITEPQVIQFIRFLVTDRKVSTSYQNQAINAIKFFYERVLGGQRKFYFIDRPIKEKTLPTVLNEEETVALFKAVENIKHKCMLMLAYSAGLRLGEIIRLKWTDIDRNRMQIKIVQSKGKKDRYARLSEKLLVILAQYYREYKPRIFVFEGAKGGQYSSGSMQNLIKDVALKAGISKRVTMHTLRHTYATHSLEQGVDLRYIQAMMGHGSTKITEVYTHITTKGFDQIKSPLDNLDI